MASQLSPDVPNPDPVTVIARLTDASPSDVPALTADTRGVRQSQNFIYKQTASKGIDFSVSLTTNNNFANFKSNIILFESRLDF